MGCGISMDSNVTGRKRKNLRALSLRKSLGLIVAGMVVLCGGLSAAAVWGSMKVQERLRESHTIRISLEEYLYYPYSENGILEGIVIPADGMTQEENAAAEDEPGLTAAGAPEWTKEELFLYHAAEYSAVLLPILIISAGIVGAAALFYQRKLKEPISCLEDGIERIKRGELEFVLEYESGDEMGRLCRTFELMRSEVLRNNQAMWRMAEERRRVNASIAHELRTPLTVIQGYTEYLLKNIPRGKVTADKLMNTLEQLKAAAERLADYTESVRELVSLEDLEIHPGPVRIGELADEIREYLQILVSGAGLSADLTVKGENEECMLDSGAFRRVLENLMSNAMRYAASEIKVMLCAQEKRIILTVRDDGPGFTREARENAGIPFQKGRNKDGHYGMGLYLCRLLCEKHGGEMEIAGEPGQGAVVKAVFGTGSGGNTEVRTANIPSIYPKTGGKTQNY